MPFAPKASGKQGLFYLSSDSWCPDYVGWGWRFQCPQEPSRQLRDPCDASGYRAIERGGACGELGGAYSPKGLYVAT